MGGFVPISASRQELRWPPGGGRRIINSLLAVSYPGPCHCFTRPPGLDHSPHEFAWRFAWRFFHFWLPHAGSQGGTGYLRGLLRALLMVGHVLLVINAWLLLAIKSLFLWHKLYSTHFHCRFCTTVASNIQLFPSLGLFRPLVHINIWPQHDSYL